MPNKIYNDHLAGTAGGSQGSHNSWQQFPHFPKKCPQCVWNVNRRACVVETGHTSPLSCTAVDSPSRTRTLLFGYKKRIVAANRRLFGEGNGNDSLAWFSFGHSACKNSGGPTQLINTVIINDSFCPLFKCTACTFKTDNNKVGYLQVSMSHLMLKPTK